MMTAKKISKAVSISLCLFMLATTITACKPAKAIVNQSSSGNQDSSYTSGDSTSSTGSTVSGALSSAVTGVGTNVSGGSTGSKAVSKASGSTIAKPAGSTTNYDAFGKYTKTITLNAVRILDSTTKFDSSSPETTSIDQNCWETAYEKQLGIKINYLWTTTADQYDAKWNVSVASGSIPDVAQVDSLTYKMLVNSQLVQDMTTSYNNYASVDYKAANDADGNVLKSFSVFNGKLMGLPLNGVQPDNAPVLLIRKDWLKKVGMSEPKTIDDVIAVAKAFKEHNLGGSNTVGLGISKDVEALDCNISGFLNSCGAYYNIWTKDSSGSLVYGSIQPAMKNALLKLQGMYKAGLINTDFSVKSYNQVTTDIGSGKIGMTFGSFAGPLVGITDNIQKDTSADWEVISLPSLNSSTTVHPQATVSPGTFFFVKKGIAHPEAAVKLCNLGLKLLGQDYHTYGTSADGKIQRQKYELTGIAKPWQNLNRYLETTAAISTGKGANYNFTNDLYKSTYTDVNNALTNNNRSLLAKALVFGPNGTFSIINKYKNSNLPVIDQFQTLPTATMTTMNATLKLNIDAAFLKIIMGDDISNFDTMTTNWKNMGGTQITKEVNNWYKSK